MAVNLNPFGLYSNDFADGIDLKTYKAQYQNPSAGNLSGANSYTQDLTINDTGVYQIVANANPNKCGSPHYSYSVVATIRCWVAWNAHYTPFMSVQQHIGDTAFFDWVIYYSANGNEYTSFIPTSAHNALGRTERYWTNSDVYLRCKISGVNYNCNTVTPQPRGFHIYKIGECP